MSHAYTHTHQAHLHRVYSDHFISKYDPEDEEEEEDRVRDQSKEDSEVVDSSWESHRSWNQLWYRYFPESQSVDRPHDYYISPTYHDGFVVKCYLNTMTRFGNYMINDVNSFNHLVIFTICLAGVVAGVETYPGMDNAYMNGIDDAVLAIFATEVILKIWAEGVRPWR